MMREAVGFAGSLSFQREDCALSDEMRRSLVLVQFGED